MSVEEFKKMITLEKEYSERLSSSAKEVTNLVVKTVMEAVAQDSLKHSVIYEVLVELFKERPMVSEAEMERIVSEVEQHIKVEEEMIKYLKGLLERGIENKAIKFFVETLLKDELYHHALLKNVLEMIVRRESFTESDAWEQVWKDVALHGGPGG